MAELATHEPSGPTDKRRGHRFPVVVPVEARWTDARGKSVKATGQAKEVNAHGGLLDLAVFPSVGSELDLSNLISGDTFRARVVAVRRSRERGILGVAVELVIPSETFWGVNFQLKRTSAQLLKLEQAIRSGGIDQRILTDFRDAVDYVRKTAWAVQEWQERQLQHHDPQTVLPLLTAERIRRGTQLCGAILADLNSHEVTGETAGLPDLFRAIASIHQRLNDLIADAQA
jgi:hypothetical protein